jgi:formylglycine-generating enzyme required for sulfatase activity
VPLIAALGRELQNKRISVIVCSGVGDDFLVHSPTLKDDLRMVGVEWYLSTRRVLRRSMLICVGALYLQANLIGGLIAADEPPPPVVVADAEAKAEAEMKVYKEVIIDSDVTIEMLPIKGGKYKMGSSESETGREEDEGPQREVEISPFWMAKFEITWDAYDIWMSDLDIFRRQVANREPTVRDRIADVFQVSQPTKPYTDMTFGMGKRGFPAVCMTQHSARTFCKWLSAKTGRYYRLPTEAEWEYACRAGTTTAYSFGDDPEQLDDFAWYSGNTEDGYSKVGRKKPNPWGLHDMHGNVAEWVLDQHTEDGYSESSEMLKDPLEVPLTLYPRVVRGGGWDQDAESLRSAAREGSTEDWIAQDPQEPVSIWYLTDALHVGFRIVRPLTTPSEEEIQAKWDKNEPVQVDRPKPKEDH